MKRTTTKLLGGIVVAAALFQHPAAADSGRVPAVGHVGHPHSYYWREMYLPQLTSGPSGAAFSPDGGTLVYSMAGSLWRQAIGDGQAVELTAGPGYDFQPDWAPDGKTVFFTRHQGDNYHLMMLDLATGTETQVTDGVEVAVEPRVSPDGRHLAFVSTRDTSHFTLYLADITATGLTNIRAAVTPRQSGIDRYYYGKADHAVNPSWSPDSKRLYFMGNREVVMGSGDLWSVAADDPADLQRVLVEETTWAARPELAPDGKRLMYASYRGRQWHQLWLTTPTGQSPLPLTFGEFDLHGARWSPDGKQIVYTSNEDGGLALWVQTVVGGARTEIKAERRIHKRPMQPISFEPVDEKGKALSARISVLGSDGRHYGPDDARLHADDGFDPKIQDHENHYFRCAVTCTVMVPEGGVRVLAMNGFDHRPVHMEAMGNSHVRVKLVKNSLPVRFGKFLSADMHVHMNYGGQYRQSPALLAADAKAEGLDIIYNLAVNKEERIPDIAEYAKGTFEADGVTIFQGQEYHTSYWGHLGLLNLEDHYLTPDFASYRHTALASPYPHNGAIIDLAHAQGAIAGYVHPFDEVPDVRQPVSHMLPADVVMGRADYMEVVSFADHVATADVWHKFLNLGFHLAAGAGTDAMSNYASLRGPVGLNRLYIQGKNRDPRALVAAIRAGHSFASNGPLLGFTVNGRAPGETIELAAPGKVVLDAAVRSNAPTRHREILFNGAVIATLAPGVADLQVDVHIPESGWLLLRAYDPDPSPYVQDLYPYATTNPVWVTVAGHPHKSPADAAYFADWLARAIEVTEGRAADFNTAQEKTDTLDYLKAARDKFMMLSRGE